MIQGKNDKMNTEAISYKLTYRRYLMNKDKVKSLFTELSMPEYIALHSIEKSAENQHNNDNRIYLKDLSVLLELPMPGVSKMVSELKERGLVIWSHDGNGSEGTYITITDAGMESMKRQEENLKAYYERVINKFGKDNLINLLQQLDEFEAIMDSEFTEGGYDSDDK